MSNPAPIEQLIHELSAEFESSSKAPAVPELLCRYGATHDDWRRYAHFADDHYTRNLVIRTEVFDLMLLCWDRGQQSPIHNHEGQRCWMAVLEEMTGSKSW